MARLAGSGLGLKIADKLHEKGARFRNASSRSAPSMKRGGISLQIRKHSLAGYKLNRIQLSNEAKFIQDIKELVGHQLRVCAHQDGDPPGRDYFRAALMTRISLLCRVGAS